MKKTMSKSLLMTALITGLCIWGGQEAFAAEKLNEFALDEYIVTATRTEKRDIDIPVSTEVFTKEDLEKTGTTNVASALSNALGVTFITYGPDGASQGSKNSNIIIRGMDRGTLVLINGSPLNLNGRYNLEDMPFDGIERIEVVRGGGSVLYGSEAIGGVVNIITTNGVKNKVSIAAGNNDRKSYEASYQLGKLSLAASHKEWGKSTRTSEQFTSTKTMHYYLKDMDKDSIFLNYNFDKKSNLMIQHTESEKSNDYFFGRGYADSLLGKNRYNKVYQYEKNFAQYNFNDGALKGNIYFNEAKTETDTKEFLSSKGSSTGYPKFSNAKDKNVSYGFDINNNWIVGNNKYLVGITYQNEKYNPDEYANDQWDRNNYSIYAQWEKDFDDKNNLIISGRQSWGELEEEILSDFSGQIQYVHKLTDDQSVYASVGQSYRLPYLRELYSSGDGYLAGNRNLEPEKGVHYELGWKKEAENHLWKVALFNYYIEDNISYTLQDNGTSLCTNEDVKNTGVEASVKYQGDNGFNYNIGFSYGDPKAKTRKDNALNKNVKDYWDRQYGRFQINGGIGYTYGKWSTNLTANYMWQRVASPSSDHSFDIKPYLLTSMNIKYAVDDNSDITLSMENLLDREDNFGGSTTAYYSTPRCYLLKYTYKF